MPPQATSPRSRQSRAADRDELLDRSLPGAEFVAEEPEQFNDVVRADRRDPGPDSFDVVAPDGYLHAMRGAAVEPTGESSYIPPRPWVLAVAAPTTTLVELLMAATSEIATRGGGPVTWWRANASDADDRIAARVGFTRDRAQHQLRVRLPISFDPNAADGIDVTEFDLERDGEDWVGTNNAAFAGHAEQGNWTLDQLVARTKEPWFDPELFLVARDPETGAMLGFNWLKVHEARPEHHEPRIGEIYVIGVAPAGQRRGLGYALAGLGLRALHQRNITTGMLYVAADNEPALALYRRLGFSIHRTDFAYTNTVTAL